MSSSSPYGSRVIHTKGSLRDSLHKRVETTLSREGISNAVVCPEDVDKNEWIAVHTMDFYNDICMLYNVVHDECTVQRCNVMSAGENYYRWKDNNHYRVPALLPARIYIDYLLNWLVSQFENEHLFPVREGVPFPNDYLPQIQTMFRRMFRVYAHIWYNHLEVIKLSDCESSFRFSLSHYLYFVNQFHLVTPDVLFPLAAFVNELTPSLPLVVEMNKAIERKKQRQSQPVVYQRLTSMNRGEGIPGVVAVSAAQRVNHASASANIYCSSNYLPNDIHSKNQSYPFVEEPVVVVPAAQHLQNPVPEVHAPVVPEVVQVVEVVKEAEEEVEEEVEEEFEEETEDRKSCCVL